MNAELSQISETGVTVIKFTPPIAAVANDWNRLWSIEERSKLTQSEQEDLEEELLKILHVKFVQNSEEAPQRFVLSNLTDFQPDGIVIRLNFSDPILVS